MSSKMIALVAFMSVAQAAKFQIGDIVEYQKKKNGSLVKMSRQFVGLVPTVGTSHCERVLITGMSEYNGLTGTVYEPRRSTLSPGKRSLTVFFDIVDKKEQRPRCKDFPEENLIWLGEPKIGRVVGVERTTGEYTISDKLFPESTTSERKCTEYLENTRKLHVRVKKLSQPKYQKGDLVEYRDTDGTETRLVQVTQNAKWKQRYSKPYGDHYVVRVHGWSYNVTDVKMNEGKIEYTNIKKDGKLLIDPVQLENPILSAERRLNPLPHTLHTIEERRRRMRRLRRRRRLTATH